MSNDLSHPDAIIRLTSTVLCFRCPEITAKGSKLSFVRSFRTVGTHETTKTVMRSADSARSHLYKSLSTKKKAYETVAGAAQKYIPLINQILLTCKVQPENARLDERLIFEWASGIEEKPHPFKSEAIMYELVMVMATEAMATAGVGSEQCTKGDFAAACRSFKKASGILKCLSTEQLPTWHSRNEGNVSLPAEATLGVCEAFVVLFLAIAQQMAVAVLLMKDGTPNWTLLAKLSLGISEQMQEFVSDMRSKAAVVKAKMDPHFFVLMTFQIELQKSLSMYFLARDAWESHDYGLAIAMLVDSISKVKTRDGPTSAGLPEIKAGSPLKAISNDLKEMKTHMNLLLKAWEKDNSSVYFEKVPLSIPEGKTLEKGTQMMKADEYHLEDVDPVPLILSESAAIQSQEAEDEEIARRLQEQLNT